MATNNINNIVSDLILLFSYLFMFIILSLMSLSFNFSGAANPVVPAMFAIGDSLLDVGNNNYLQLSLAKADFPYNGIDFPTKQCTGRFSNGKNAADFLAEKVGLPTSPPYLSISLSNNSPSILTGVSFASGGAGILDETDYSQTIPLKAQVDMYTQEVYQAIVEQLGSYAAHNHLSKSIFVVIIGSNDIFSYFGPSDHLRRSATPQQYVDSMTVSLKTQLKRLHDHGARKFAIVGIPGVGCCPSQRNKEDESCNKEINYWSLKYNQGLNSTMQELKSELRDINYSIFDIYHLLQNYIDNPATYGFKEVKSACCGLGQLNSDVPCLPISKCCPKRRDHIFWDLYHPTEATVGMAVDQFFDGSPLYTFPITMKQLATL